MSGSTRVPRLVSEARVGGRAIRDRTAQLAMATDRRLLAEAVAVVGGLAFAAILVTWPLAANFTSQITSEGLGWDAAGYTWDLWFNAEQGLRLWGSGDRSVLSAPFGYPTAASTNTTLFVTLGPGWLVTSLAGPVVAYNVAVLSGLVLSAAAMYLLLRWIRLGIAASAFGALVMMVAPYQLLKAMVHVPFVHLEWLPLLLLAGLRWMERPSVGRSGWVVAATGLAWLTTPYYGLVATVLAVLIGFIVMLRVIASDGLAAGLRLGGLAALIGFVFVGVPLAALFASGRGAIEDSFTQPREALDVFGARFSDYFLPDGGNFLMRALYGPERWVELSAPGGERTAFVGWVTLALAVGAVVYVLLRRTSLPDRIKHATLLSGVAIPVFLWFSLASPTTVFGVRVAVPAEAIFEYAPFYRAYGRFSIGVFVALVVLAAIAVWALARGRGPVLQAGVAAVALGAVALTVSPELPINTAYPVTVADGDPREAEAWNWLRDEDEQEGIVFEYPTGSLAYGPQFEVIERYWQYGQSIHERPVLNGGFTPGLIGFDFTRNVNDPRWPGTAEKLAGAGVSTVVINPWAYGPLGQEAPDVENPPEGFELAQVFSDGTAAWNVVADPDPVVAVFRGSWGAPTVSGEQLWFAAPLEGGEVTVVPWEPGRYGLTFLMGAADAPEGARAQVIGPEGVITEIPLGGADPVPVTVDLDFGSEPVDLRIVPIGGVQDRSLGVSAPTIERPS